MIDKKYDISLFPLIGGSSIQSLGFGNSLPLAICGNLKASQNFLRVLFTTKGERLEDPLFGTYFNRDIKSGMVFSPIQMTQIFSSNGLMAISCLKDRYPDETIAAERVKSVKLLHFTSASPTVLDLSILLCTESNNTIDFNLPIPI